MTIDSLGAGSLADFAFAEAWAACQKIPVGKLRRSEFGRSSAANPRGLEEADPTARFVRTDEPLFSEDVLRFVRPSTGGCGIIKSACCVPQSVVLFAAPRSCARHGSVVGVRDGWRGRVHYLEVSEDEFVMGANVARIEEAVACILAELPEPPRAFFVCGTCVDDLLGTDLAGICRVLEKRHGIPFSDLHLPPISVRSSAPPPVRVQRSVYGLLVRAGRVPEDEREPDAVNLVCSFARFSEEDDLFAMLRDMGFTTVRQLQDCATYDDFLAMRRSGLNLCLRPFGRPVCKDMERQLGIPFVVLETPLLPERMEAELGRFAALSGRSLDAARYRAQAEARMEKARPRLEGVRVAVGAGEGHGSVFETACLLGRLGARIAFIMEDRVSARDWDAIDELAELDPGIPVYPPGHPAFSCAGRLPVEADVAVGLGAGRLCGGCSVTDPDDELDHLGFSAALNMIDEVCEALGRPRSAEELYMRRSRVRRSMDREAAR